MIYYYNIHILKKIPSKLINKLIPFIFFKIASFLMLLTKRCHTL